ncbi:MAG: 3-phosphoshikimate 1-carboxyvinyltransferase [Clostridiales bacterium]|nr:3-phosphoshikimate 1-carboxyvinyltransferase [Clostridiales bacterium]
MSEVFISRSSLDGIVTVPPSKSVAHRALICSFLAGGGTVEPIINSMDMKATLGVIESLKNNDNTLNCIESGSTMRFTIPIAAALGRSVTFTGVGSLLNRTLGEYTELLPLHGVSAESDGKLPLTISGKLKNGNYEVRGDVSSQYVTGFLMALPLLDGDSAVVLKTSLESKPYADMTVGVMDTYGVSVRETDFGYLIKGGQKYKKINYTVESDWSHSTFFLVAGAIGGDVTVKGMNMNSAQGDREIVQVLKQFGAKTVVDDDSVRCVKSELNGAHINAKNIPDLVPAIAVLAAFSKGRTVIDGAQRLRFKESNRIYSVVSNLKAIGVDATETEDGMIINGTSAVNGARLKGFNDHRIVMAFSVAALFANGDTVIDDAESINKSYPSFFEDYNMLGGKANVI